MESIPCDCMRRTLPAHPTPTRRPAPGAGAQASWRVPVGQGRASCAVFRFPVWHVGFVRARQPQPCRHATIMSCMFQLHAITLTACIVLHHPCRPLPAAGDVDWVEHVSDEASFFSKVRGGSSWLWHGMHSFTRNTVTAICSEMTCGCELLPLAGTPFPLPAKGVRERQQHQRPGLQPPRRPRGRRGRSRGRKLAHLQ